MKREEDGDPCSFLSSEVPPPYLLGRWAQPSDLIQAHQNSLRTRGVPATFPVEKVSNRRARTEAPALSPTCLSSRVWAPLDSAGGHTCSCCPRGCFCVGLGIKRKSCCIYLPRQEFTEIWIRYYFCGQGLPLSPLPPPLPIHAREGPGGVWCLQPVLFYREAHRKVSWDSAYILGVQGADGIRFLLSQ